MVTVTLSARERTAIRAAMAHMPPPASWKPAVKPGRLTRLYRFVRRIVWHDSLLLESWHRLGEVMRDPPTKAELILGSITMFGGIFLFWQAPETFVGLGWAWAAGLADQVVWGAILFLIGSFQLLALIVYPRLRILAAIIMAGLWATMEVGFVISRPVAFINVICAGFAVASFSTMVYLARQGASHRRSRGVIGRVR